MNQDSPAGSPPESGLPDRRFLLEQDRGRKPPGENRRTEAFRPSPVLPGRPDLPGRPFFSPASAP